MALTQSQEQALLDMLQKWTGAQERRPTKPSSLNSAVEKPGFGWHVIGYDTVSNARNLFRVPVPQVGYSLSRNDLSVPDGGGAINWSSANHLVSSRQIKSFYDSEIKAPLDRHTVDIARAQKKADDTLSYAQGIHAVVNDHDGKISQNKNDIAARLNGWKNNLVMDFGSTPPVTGASTVTFNKRFKGTPIVIVNFWGDIGNPRFSLATSNNETWGIRLSATYPGVWAVIGEPA